MKSCDLPTFTSLDTEHGVPLRAVARDAGSHMGRKTGLCFLFFNKRKCLSGAGCRYSHCVDELKPLRPLPWSTEPGSEEARELSTTDEDSSSLHSGDGSQGADGRHEGNLMPNRQLSGASSSGMPRRQVSWDPSSWCSGTSGASPGTSSMPSRQVSSGTEAASSMPSRQVSSGPEASPDASTCGPRSHAPKAAYPTTCDSLEGCRGTQEPSSPPGRRPPQASTEKTLLVMGVPKTLRQSAVAAELLAQDPSAFGAFDFLWCPWEAAKKCRNVGYFVINFPDSRDADAFQARWSGRVFSKLGAPTRQLFVKPATLQGILRNLEYCQLKRGCCLTGADLISTFAAAAATQQQQKDVICCPPRAMRFKEDRSQSPTFTSELSDGAPMLSHGTLQSPTHDIRASLLMSRRDETLLGNGQLVLGWLLLGGTAPMPGGNSGGCIDETT